jgi:hypothetical protein
MAGGAPTAPSWELLQLLPPARQPARPRNNTDAQTALIERLSRYAHVLLDATAQARAAIRDAHAAPSEAPARIRSALDALTALLDAPLLPTLFHDTNARLTALCALAAIPTMARVADEMHAAIRSDYRIGVELIERNPDWARRLMR